MVKIDDVWAILVYERVMGVLRVKHLSSGRIYSTEKCKEIHGYTWVNTAKGVFFTTASEDPINPGALNEVHGVATFSRDKVEATLLAAGVED